MKLVKKWPDSNVTCVKKVGIVTYSENMKIEYGLIWDWMYTQSSDLNTSFLIPNYISVHFLFKRIFANEVEITPE